MFNDNLTASMFMPDDFENESEYTRFRALMEERSNAASALADAQAEGALLACKSAAWLGKPAPLSAWLGKAQALAFWQGKAELFAAFLCGNVVATQKRNGAPVYNVARHNQTGGLVHDAKLGLWQVADGGSETARKRYALAVRRSRIKGAHKGAALLELLPALKWQSANENNELSIIAALAKARKFKICAEQAQAWLDWLDTCPVK